MLLLDYFYTEQVHHHHINPRHDAIFLLPLYSQNNQGHIEVGKSFYLLFYHTYLGSSIHQKHFPTSMGLYVLLCRTSPGSGAYHDHIAGYKDFSV